MQERKLKTALVRLGAGHLSISRKDDLMAEAEAPANVNITSALPDDIREGLAVENVKAIGGGTAFLQNLAHANAVSNQQNMNGIIAAATGKIIESIIATSPSEGGESIAALQQLMKGAQTTPPVTP